jgi:uncharacterized protein (DUF779 family)
MDAPPRVVATEAAMALLGELRGRFGPLLFHQSGGCCDGSAPMLFPLDEFKIGQRDVLLGTLDDTPVYIGGQQFELWRHTQLVLDAVPGRGAGFSLETPTGKRFITRSRVFDAAELAALGEAPPEVDPLACALPERGG